MRWIGAVAPASHFLHLSEWWPPSQGLQEWNSDCRKLKRLGRSKSHTWTSSMFHLISRGSVVSKNIL